MALACGCDTEKMKYGHRGANHPVKDLKTGRVYISSQNHGYMVKESSVPKEIAEVAFVNVNDGTVEGLRYLQKKSSRFSFIRKLVPDRRIRKFCLMNLSR